jgi:predicted small integral membrane protein
MKLIPWARVRLIGRPSSTGLLRPGRPPLAARRIIHRREQGIVDQRVGTMVIMRLSKIAVITALAAYALIVAYDNIVDYGSNYDFVKHVLSMDTTFPGNALRQRAISDESIWRLAYELIIGIEWLIGVLLTVGALVLLGRLGAPAHAFNRAKVWAIAGLTVGFGLWFFGFMVIAGEYFAMWQSTSWNGQEAAFRIATEMLGVLVFVCLPDGDLA